MDIPVSRPTPVPDSALGPGDLQKLRRLLGADKTHFIQDCEAAAIELWRFRETAKRAPNRLECKQQLRRMRKAVKALLGSEPPPSARWYPIYEGPAKSPIAWLGNYLALFRGWPEAEQLRIQLRDATPWLQARVTRGLQASGPTIGEQLQHIIAALNEDENKIDDSPDWRRALYLEATVLEDGTLIDVSLVPVPPIGRQGIPAEAHEPVIYPLARKLRAAGLTIAAASSVLEIVTKRSHDSCETLVKAATRAASS